MYTLILLTLFLFIVIIYLFSTRKYNYWRKQDVPHMKPLPILGNFGDYILLKDFSGVVIKKICEQFPNAPYIGAFYGTEPVLIVKNLELVKLVLTKHFCYFNGREVSDYSEREAVTQSLFFTHSDNWKVLRQNLSPLFTAAKMKNMFYLIEKCTHDFEKHLNAITEGSRLINITNLFAAFTMDCIGSCAFGIETNVMQNGSNNEFRKIGQLMFNKSTFSGLKNIIRSIWPSIFYAFGFKLFPNVIKDFFSKLLTQVFEVRDYKPTCRNDFVDLILTLANSSYITGDSFPDFKTGDVKKVKLKVKYEMLVGQCIAFFGAGYETSAATLSLTVYELAKNKEAQKRAIEDVDTYLQKHDNKLEYDVVTQLPYVQACINEALRLYPVLNNLTREVMADYTFPTGLRLKKGDRIHIPVYYLQRNPLYYEQPEVFRPERFLPEEIHKILPYTYMPFGEGPRFCIGMRFAKMQMLAGLVTILRKYTLKLNETTPTKLVFDPRVIVPQPVEDIYINFIRRKDLLK